MTKLGVAILTGLTCVVLVAASDVTGNWELESIFDDRSVAGGGFDCAFKQDGERLTGTCAAGEAPVTGEVKGQNISWQMKAGRTQDTITYSGTVNETGTVMSGRFSSRAWAGASRPRSSNSCSDHCSRDAEALKIIRLQNSTWSRHSRRIDA